MKRWIAVGALISILLLLVALGIFMLSDRGGSAVFPEGTRFYRREILIPGARFVLPDAEDALYNPGLRYAVDPEKPLDPELLQDLELDLLQALRDELLPRIEAEVEGLIFE